MGSNFLDYFIARKILAAGEKTKIPVDLNVDKDKMPQEKFPSAPSDVYHKILPDGFNKDLKSKPFEEHPKLSDEGAEGEDLSYDGEYIALLAKTLREFDDGPLTELKKQQRQALEKLKTDYGYSAKTKELEEAVQNYGNKILHIMEQTGNTTRALFRLQEHLLAVSRELKSKETPPNEMDAMLKALSEKLSKEEVQQIIARKDQLVKSMTMVTYSLAKQFTMAPIREDYHTKKQSIKAIKLLIAEIEDELVGQLKKVIDDMTSFESKLVEIQTEIEDVLGSNVTQVDFNREDKSLAASKK